MGTRRATSASFHRMALYGTVPAAPRLSPSSSPRWGFLSAILLSVGVVALLAVAGVFSSSSMTVLESKDPLDDGGLPTSVVMKSMGKIDTKTRLSASAPHQDKPIVSDLKQMSMHKIKDTTGRIADDADDGMSDGQLAVLEEAAEPMARQRRSLGQRLNERVDREFADAKREKAAKMQHYKSTLDKLNQGFAEQMQKALTGSSNVGDVTTIIDSHDANYLRHTSAYGKRLSLRTQKAILAAAENQNAKEKKGLVSAEGHGMVHTRPVQHKFGIVHTADGFELHPYIAKAARTTALLAEALRAPHPATQQLPLHSVGIADTPDGDAAADEEEEEEDPRLNTPDGCACDGPADEDAGPRCNCIGDPEFVQPDGLFSPDEVTTWKASAQQILRDALPVTARNPQVLPTADSIDGFLQDLLERVDGQAAAAKHQPRSLTKKLVVDAHHLQALAARDPQARDLLARRLTKLNRVLPTNTQKLLDFDTVYIPPYVDDLDDYLQGVINEVEGTEIPNLDEEEGDAAAKGPSAQQLKQTQLKQKQAAKEEGAEGAVLPSLFGISFELHRMLKASLALHPPATEEQQEEATRLEHTVQSLLAVAANVPASRDLIAEKLSLLKKASRVSGKVAEEEAAGSASKQKLLDYDTVYIAPYVDDLDDYLAAVIAEVESTEIPNLDEEEEKAAPAALAARTQTLRPLFVTQNIRAKNRAHYHGEYEDKMQWLHHPFDTPPEERPNAAKLVGDHWGDTLHTMVHKAHNLRFDPADTNPVHNAYGFEGGDIATAEAPAQSADGPDTARSVGVQTQKSLQYGHKLCQLVNCYNEDAVPFPKAARWARMQGLKAAAEKPVLGDEIFDLGVSSGVNDGDVIMPADSDSVSASIFTARKPALSAPKSRKPSSHGIPLPL